MKAFKLVISLLLLVPTNWALSMASPGSTSVSSSSLSLSPPSHTSGDGTKDSAAATLGDLYRKSRQSRCVRCYDDRYGDDYERSRYGASGGGGASGYTSRTNDDRASNWYYPSDRYDRYDDRDRVRYGGARDYDRYYYPYNGYYRDRNEDRYNTRTYDRYDRDRYDSRSSYDRPASENRGYGYDNRDRYYSNDRYNDYYRGGDRYADRNRGGSNYDRYGQDDRYYTRYDYRNYRPWDETYRGQSGFDNSGRGYYFANDRPNDYYKPPYRPDGRPPGPSTPGPTYLPREHYDQSRPSGSYEGYPDSRPGSASSPSSSSSSSSSSSMGSSSPGSDYGNRPRDDVNGGSGGGSGSTSGGDNKNGYSGSGSGGGGGGSWSYVNDREKDASYKGGIRDKDNQSSSYGSGGRGRPLGGSYLLDRDSNAPEGGVMVNNQDKPDDSKINDSPMASKLSAESSKSTTNDHMADTKDTN